MASVFENVGDFSVQRLRNPDAAFLSGAVRGIGEPPLPSVVARGPASALNGGTVGAAEFWGLGVSMPALPDIVWVLIQANFGVFIDGTLAPPTKVTFLTVQDVADFDNVQGPRFASSTILTATGPGGVFNELAGIRGGDGLWIPIDPFITAPGWTPGILMTNGANAATAGLLRADLRDVVFIGYPINYWNTGQLWQTTANRGS